MAESGLPCFGRGQPLANLRKHFHLEMTEPEAAGATAPRIMRAAQLVLAGG